MDWNWITAFVYSDTSILRNHASIGDTGMQASCPVSNASDGCKRGVDSRKSLSITTATITDSSSTATVIILDTSYGGVRLHHCFNLCHYPTVSGGTTRICVVWLGSLLLWLLLLLLLLLLAVTWCTSETPASSAATLAARPAFVHAR
jgi:hypothetical protein